MFANKHAILLLTLTFMYIINILIKSDKKPWDGISQSMEKKGL